MKIFLALIAGLLCTTQANAWDGQVSGTISSYSVMAGVDASNAYLRVSLSGNPTLCTGGTNWVYINNNEVNYSTVVAAVFSAKVSGANVVLYANRDANGACHLGQVAVP